MIKILKLISVNKKGLIVAAAWGIFQNAFVSFANPYLLKLLFDEATIKHNFDRFAIIAVSSFFIFIGWRISDYYYSVFVEKLKNNTTLILSINALKNYFSIPFTEIIKNERGYFITRIYDDIRNISDGIEVILNFINSFFMLTGAFIVLLLISYKLAFILLFIVIPLRYISSKYSKDIRTLSIREREEEARMKNTLGEVVSSYKLTKFFNIGDSAERSFRDSLVRFLQVSLTRFKVSMSVVTINRAVMSAAEIMVVILGGYMMIKNLMTFGGFMGFMNAFWYVIEGFFSMVEILPQIKKFEGVAERIKDFEVKTDEKYKNVIYGKDSIELRGIDFGYNGNKVFENMSFKIEKGERLLIVGPNGSGKTTLGALISGLLPPVKGRVITLPYERVSAVLMPVSFPPVKIVDLIKLFDKGEEILEKLGLKPLGSKYYGELSEGEKKKLQVLLGLLKDADLYIFDEPLANVDEGSKKLVIETIMEYTRGKTLVVIMHGNKEFYEKFDRVINIEDLTKSGGVK